MSFVSILVPSVKTKATTKEEIINNCHRHLGFHKSDIELFKLVPFSHDSEFVEPFEIAVRIHNANLSLNTIENVIKQRDNNRDQLQKTNEALKTYLKELKKMRKFFMDSLQESGTDESKTGQKEIVKRALKYKQLEDDNKRLRQLLKTQLENSENLRIETQNTVETLREEFDLLVKELIMFKNQEKDKSVGSVNVNSKIEREKPASTGHTSGGAEDSLKKKMPAFPNFNLASLREEEKNRTKKEDNKGTAPNRIVPKLF